jgi:hypothetical protein
LFVWVSANNHVNPFYEFRLVTWNKFILIFSMLLINSVSIVTRIRDG